MELVLGHLLGDVFDEDVGLRIEVSLLLLVQDNLLSIADSVVHLCLASAGLLLGVEVEVTEALGSLGAHVDHDISRLEFVALGAKELEEVVVKSGCSEVSNVE